MSGRSAARTTIAAIGVGYARIGSAARGFDADMARFTGQPYPMRSGEGLLELTYRLQLRRRGAAAARFPVRLQPRRRHPRARTGSGRRLGDAAVFGLRTVVTF